MVYTAAEVPLSAVDAAPRNRQYMMGLTDVTVLEALLDVGAAVVLFQRRH